MTRTTTDSMLARATLATRATRATTTTTTTRRARRGARAESTAATRATTRTRAKVEGRDADDDRSAMVRTRGTTRGTTRARGTRGTATRAVLGSGDADEDDAAATRATNQGRLLLVLVAMAYGSLSVSLKLVFESAGAPTAGVLGGVRGLMTILCFAPMLMAKDSKGGEGFETGAGFWRSAAELAFWNLGNQGLCNVALLFTDATRVSFFTQASIAFTPFIASLGGDKVKSMTWLGCALAFCGVAVLGMDGGAAAELGGNFNLGDLLSLAGAASYSMYVYRIGQFAKQGFSGQGLQVWKNVFLAAMYGGWMLYDVFAFTSGVPGAAVPWAGWQNLKIWVLLAFTAIVPGCLADLGQAKGQETVSASESSVLLAGEPLFAAVFGAVTLGEFLGPMGYVGGALIVFGGLVAGDVFASKKSLTK